MVCVVDGGLQSLERAHAVTCTVYCSAGTRPAQLHASSLTAQIKGDWESPCLAPHKYAIPTGFAGLFQLNSKLFEDLVVKCRPRGATKN